MKRHLFSLVACCLLACPAALPAADGTVKVESPGTNPSGKWVKHATRLVEKLDGYTPGGPVATGTYGGWLARSDAATGYFHAKKIGDRWWLIDPEGHYYISMAANAVTASDKEMKSGFGNAAGWVRRTSGFLEDRSFNGAGAWSSDALARHRSGLSRTITMQVLVDYAQEHGIAQTRGGITGFVDDCIPVFNPDFPAFCDASMARLAKTRDDPWILGIFSDNELPYSEDLLDRFLRLDAGNAKLAPNRDAAIAWMQANVGGTDPAKITKRHRQAFEAHVFDRYYSVVSAAIRRHDPNHLYLGSRLPTMTGHIRSTRPFWNMIGKYVDVVAINYYKAWGPIAEDVSNWERWSGKPLLVTEFYAKALDVPGLANTGGAGFVVRTQEDRARFYQHFALGCLESKAIVGWHWFKYRDDPASATQADQAGGANKGLFSRDFKPYDDLLAGAAAVNGEAYSLTEFFDKGPERSRPARRGE